MSNFDPIDEALNIESEIVKQPKTHDLSRIDDSDDLVVSERNDKQKDYEYARANFRRRLRIWMRLVCPILKIM